MTRRILVPLLFCLQAVCATQVLYQPSLSSTFIAHQELPFTVQYADASAIEAITCVDYVQVGEYKARVPFGCFLDTNTPMLKNVDGIAGFGIPKLGARGESLPMPLLWALTDSQNAESNAKGLSRKFMFFSSRDRAELQLGGYDPASVVGGTLTEMQSRSTGEFVVGISSVRIGRTPQEATELLNFADSIKDDKRVLDGVLDTGTSCLVLPSSDLDGKLKTAPFGLFVKKFLEQEHPPPEFSAEAARIKNEGGSLAEPGVWLTIEGKDYHLPYETLLISNTKKPCVRGSPPMSQSSILLGDVFFRAYAVLFDVSRASRKTPATIGLGAINPDYRIVPKSSPILPAGDLLRMAVHRNEIDPDAVDKLPIENRRGTQYFLELTVGTPPQLLKVALDTGSSTLGVFVGQQSMNEVMAVELGAPIRLQRLNHDAMRMRSIPVIDKAGLDPVVPQVVKHSAKPRWQLPFRNRRMEKGGLTNRIHESRAARRSAALAWEHGKQAGDWGRATELLEVQAGGQDLLAPERQAGGLGWGGWTLAAAVGCMCSLAMVAMARRGGFKRRMF